MTVPTPAVLAARAHRAAAGSGILAEFAELLAIPNVSRRLDDVRRNAAHITAMLDRRGIESRIVGGADGGPVVVGHRPTPGASRTIGFYAHYDGQPVDQPDWAFDPFIPTLCTAPLEEGGVPRAMPGPGEAIDPDWRLYGRSTADDKAPIVALCAALDALAAAGVAPTVNVVVLLDGEEEIGSVHLPGYLEELGDELGADAWLVCDGPVHQARRPQLVFGVRGIAELEITVYGPNRALHSGHYGNWAPNPAMELAHLLASMKAPLGDVLVDGFYEGTAPITEADRDAVAALPDHDDALRAEFGLAVTEADGAPHALRMMLPSLNVRGLAAGGVGPTSANIVPAEASASIDIRLAPGNDPEEMLNRVEDHIRGQGFHIVREPPDQALRVEHERVALVTRKPSYPGTRLPVTSPLARDLLAAAEAAAGEPVIAMPTLGGSVPIHHIVSALAVPVAITPFANHDNNQHAANENLRIGNLWYGIDLMAALLTMA